MVGAPENMARGDRPLPHEDLVLGAPDDGDFQGIGRAVRACQRDAVLDADHKRFADGVPLPGGGEFDVVACDKHVADVPPCEAVVFALEEDAIGARGPAAGDAGARGFHQKALETVFDDHVHGPHDAAEPAPCHVDRVGGADGHVVRASQFRGVRGRDQQLRTQTGGGGGAGQHGEMFNVIPDGEPCAAADMAIDLLVTPGDGRAYCTGSGVCWDHTNDGIDDVGGTQGRSRGQEAEERKPHHLHGGVCAADKHAIPCILYRHNRNVRARSWGACTQV